PGGIGSWQLAAVTAVDAGAAQIVLKKGEQGRILLNELRWARRTLDDQRLGAGVGRASDVLKPGDIVLVEPLAAATAAKRGAPSRTRRSRSRRGPVRRRGSRSITRAAMSARRR